MPGSRYRKQKKDLNALDANSQEYWEEVLRREGLSMSRGQYPQRVSFGWNNHDTDPRNEDSNTVPNKVPQPLAGPPPPGELGPGDGPQSKPIGDNYGVTEDSYEEDSKP